MTCPEQVAATAAVFKKSGYYYCSLLAKELLSAEQHGKPIPFIRFLLSRNDGSYSEIILGTTDGLMTALDTLIQISIQLPDIQRDNPEELALLDKGAQEGLAEVVSKGTCGTA